MLLRSSQLLALVALLSTGCGLLEKKADAEGGKEERSSKKKSDDAGEKRDPIAPAAAKCAPIDWAGLKLVGDAKVVGGELQLLTAQAQSNGAWFPEPIDVSDLELTAVLKQGPELAKFADGVAFAFVDGEVPTEPGAGGPSLGVPTKPIVAAGIHYPMDEPHFFVELWKGAEGVPYLDEPSAREKLPREKGDRLVELSVKKGEVTLAIHTTAEASSPSTVAKSKLGLSGKRAFGLTGAAGVYLAQLGWKDLRVSAGGSCLK
jgi:hypothetical protein